MQAINSQSKKQRFKRFLKETARVLRITKKPNKEEYLTVVKVTGLGISVIGAIGFVIFLLKQLLF
jgi:protein transport protein SEC61 subunit gamma-like protein